MDFGMQNIVALEQIVLICFVITPSSFVHSEPLDEKPEDISSTFERLIGLVFMGYRQMDTTSYIFPLCTSFCGVFGNVYMYSALVPYPPGSGPGGAQQKAPQQIKKHNRQYLSMGILVVNW
jgi:hypothetical protein